MPIQCVNDNNNARQRKREKKKTPELQMLKNKNLKKIVWTVQQSKRLIEWNICVIFNLPRLNYAI